MNDKLTLMAWIVVAAVGSYGVGRAVLAGAVGFPRLFRGTGFLGALLCFVGLVMADSAKQLLLLAAAGLGLQCASLVYSVATKRAR